LIHSRKNGKLCPGKFGALSLPAGYGVMRTSTEVAAGPVAGTHYYEEERQ